MPKVNLPDGRVVHFPYDMSPQDIETAIQGMLPDGGGAPAAPGEAAQATAAPTASDDGGVLRKVDDFVRGAASGMTFGLADELAAAATTATGLGAQPGGGQTYEANLAAERSRDASASPYVRIPGEIAGALTTGVGAGRAGASLLNAAKPTVPSMAGRGAAEGSAYGAAHAFGSGEGGPQNRFDDALYGALLGGGAGGAMGGLAGRLARPAAPAASNLKDQANAAYQAADQSGVVIAGKSLDDAVDDIVVAAQGAGIDRTIHPKATAALSRLVEAKGVDRSLKDMDILRRVVKSAAASNEADERRIAGLMIDRLDDYIGNLKPSDVTAGDAPAAVRALSDARDLWSRMRKGEIMEGLIERAKTRSSQFSGSGYENALRTEFRSLAMNPKRMRGFTPDERSAIKKVAEGGPIENALRFIGKFAPRGIVSTTLAGGGGYALGGPLGSAALMGAGEVGRRGATAMTANNARLASELVRSGGNLPSPTALLPSQQRLFDALIAAETDQLTPLARRLSSQK